MRDGVGAGARRPVGVLAAAGPLLLLAGIAAAYWQPVGAPAWDGAFNLVGYALVFTAYPDGRLDSRWLALPLLGFAGLGVALLTVDPAAVAHPWWDLLPLTVLALAPVMVHRYRRRLSTVERERQRWAVLGALVTFGGMLTLGFAAMWSGSTISGLGGWAELLAMLLTPALPVALVCGLLAPRLAPVDALLAHVLRVLLCAAPVAAASGFLLALVPGPAGAWLAIAVVATGSVPLFRLAGGLADRFVYGRRLSASAAEAALDSRLAGERRPEDAPQSVADVVRQALGSPTVRVDGDGVRAAVSGDPAAPTEIAWPVDYAVAPVAVIRVHPRPGESDLTATDRQVLGLLAARSAASLHTARTVQALTAARGELVVAREEERRRLRRDLHDELAPTLVGLRLTATGLAQALRADQPRISDAAQAMASDVESALAQTRALAYGLRPPGLDDAGLVAAIRERTRSPDGVLIDVVATDEPLVLPAAVELATLRVVQEAVANVRRHARARRCTVALARTSDVLRVVIDDDGDGLPADARPGIGLASMRERVEELGGRLRIGASEQGGLRVDAMFPALAVPESRAD